MILAWASPFNFSGISFSLTLSARGPNLNVRISDVHDSDV